MESDREILAGELPRLTGERRDTAAITLTAPQQIAEFTWTFVVPAREIDAVRYEEASLDFSFKTRPHATSLAVWDNPSPLVIGEPFSVKVGATCTSGCALAGRVVEIHDETGATVASGALGDTPWPDTKALYWTSIELRAPEVEGRFSWALKFSAAELSLPHGGAAASFSFVTTRPPEHNVSITVVEKDTQAPVHDVHVRLGVHRTSTDEAGLARLAVPAGEHLLSIWKADYDAPLERTMRVTKGEEVRIEVAALPEEDPFAFWQG